MTVREDRKRYFCGARVVGEDGTGRGPKDLRMNKIACKSCLNMFIF